MNARTSKQAMDEAVKAARSAEQSDRDLRTLRMEVNRRSGAISTAGFGLCAIGNLLGADSSEHYVDEDLQTGLACAVLAIGELLKSTGNRLFEISDQPKQPATTEIKD